jgi:hypothetical protein
MSNHKDNNHDKRFKDFLAASKNASNDSMDDFEKEALEGFATIDSEQELLDLKAKMDKRAFEEVFKEEKKSSPIFWYAAAGLFLVIGLSVYFIINDPFTKRNDLAYESSPSTQEMQKVLKDNSGEEIESPALAEESEALSPAPAQKAIPKTEAFKNKALESNRDLGKQRMMKDDTEQEIFELESDAIAAAANTDEGAQVLKKLDQPTNSPTAPINSQLSSSEDLTTSTFTAPEKEMVVVTELKKQNGAIQTSSQESKRKAKESKSTSKSAEESSREASLVSSCYYTGGEDALSKDLKVLLKEKNVLLKFNATLFINENKKVERVVFTNGFDMSENDQKKVEEILKQLHKFNLNNPGSSRLLAEYQLVFIP